MSMIDDMLAKAQYRKNREDSIKEGIQECINMSTVKLAAYLTKHNCSSKQFEKTKDISIHSNSDDGYENVLLNEKCAYLDKFRVMVYDMKLYEKYFFEYGRSVANRDFSQAFVHENLHSITETFLKKMRDEYYGIDKKNILQINKIYEQLIECIACDACMKGSLFENLSKMSQNEEFVFNSEEGIDNIVGIALLTVMGDELIQNMLRIDESDGEQKVVTMIRQIIPEISEKSNVTDEIRNYVLSSIDNIDNISNKLKILSSIGIIDRTDMEDLYIMYRDENRKINLQIKDLVEDKVI